MARTPHNADAVQAEAIAHVESRRERKELSDYVLRDVNIIRDSLKMAPLRKLPRGRRGDGDQCPIAQALTGRTQDGGKILCNVQPGRLRLIRAGHRDTIAWFDQLSPYIAQFISAFDRGLLRKYEA